MATWPEIEPSSPHLTYLLLSFFLILYALFSELIRNRIHLSEPPLATLAGIASGPRGFSVLDPIDWGWVSHSLSPPKARVVTMWCEILTFCSWITSRKNLPGSSWAFRCLLRQ